MMTTDARHIQIRGIRFTGFLRKSSQKDEQGRLDAPFKILAVAKDALTEYALRYGILPRNGQ